MKDPGKLAAQLVKKHFPKLGTFRKRCTYYKTADSEYTGGVVVPVVVSSHPDVFIIFDEFTFTGLTSPTGKGENETILKIDKKAIFPALDLPVDPSVNDYLIDEDGTQWDVKGLSSDPKPAVHQLHVRPVKHNVAS